ncbi:hypothetical protein CANARDRAFT_114534 [[Candida] arabinofermentans NRRL YB-2248]|uniref:Uncharacterized protein n=1 Tax=[Candida] arabinofermentans NRRL YB-2248 TaxID=983967 RepID=A0A1E4T4N3_9ASCO|nr:hypothetical protein CANARDRAFT_114534 [[Candida] arabinofermentans NRRL YB-2248]
MSTRTSTTPLDPTGLQRIARARLNAYRSFDIEEDVEFCPVINTALLNQQQEQQQQSGNHGPMKNHIDSLSLVKILAAANQQQIKQQQQLQRSPSPNASNLRQQHFRRTPNQHYNMNSSDIFSPPSSKASNLNYGSATPGSGSHPSTHSKNQGNASLGNSSKDYHAAQIQNAFQQQLSSAGGNQSPSSNSAQNRLNNMSRWTS